MARRYSVDPTGNRVKERVTPRARLVAMGYSLDVHKRRRELRACARNNLQHGGGNCLAVAIWANYQARYTR